MQVVNLKMIGDEAWPELRDKKVKQLQKDVIECVILDAGTQQGNPVVILRSDDGDTSYILELTGKQFQAIAAALRGKYGVIE